MTDMTQEAPDLGEPTDANGDGAPPPSAVGEVADEQTMATPDELGGTGGEQEGGAG